MSPGKIEAARDGAVSLHPPSPPEQAGSGCYRPSSGQSSLFDKTYPHPLQLLHDGRWDQCKLLRSRRRRVGRFRTNIGRPQGNSAILDEKLSRLSKKPGVKASLVIDRASGSILKTIGDVSVLGTTQSRTASTAASFSNEPAAAEESTSKGIDDFAAMIWKFVNNSGEMVEEMDKDVCGCRNST